MPLYDTRDRQSIGLPWIGTESMLPAQILFVKERYEQIYGRNLDKIIPQEYEGKIY